MAEGENAEVRMRKEGRREKGDFGGANEFRGTEKDELLDDVGRKRGGVEMRAGFEESAEDFATAEFFHDGCEVEAGAAMLYREEFNAGPLEFAGLW